MEAQFELSTTISPFCLLPSYYAPWCGSSGSVPALGIEELPLCLIGYSLVLLTHMLVFIFNPPTAFSLGFMANLFLKFPLHLEFKK